MKTEKSLKEKYEMALLLLTLEKEKANASASHYQKRIAKLENAVLDLGIEYLNELNAELAKD